MYLYKTDNFFHINHYLKSVSKVDLLHRFYCMSVWDSPGVLKQIMFFVVVFFILNPVFQIL